MTDDTRPIASYNSVRSMLDDAMELLIPMIPKSEWAVCLALGSAEQNVKAVNLLRYYNALKEV